MVFINTVRFLFIAGAGFCGIVISGWIKGDTISVPELIGWGLIGVAGASMIVMIERQIRRAEPKALFMGLLGFLAGMLTAQVMMNTLPTELVLARFNLMDGESPTQAKNLINSFFAVRLAAGLFFAYLGTVVALRYTHRIDLSGASFIRQERNERLAGAKILDTSVLIDGRLADITSTAFLDGVLLLPRFVLRELQAIADSSDPMKRRRGQRGLDVVKRLQEDERINVEIVEMDYPQIRDVDSKLVALAKDIGGKVLTNDYNLNKVATIQNVTVLNINDLANALKTIVLPGEELTVFLIKEGKEHQQGVGYLDDGTMVVVDNARSYINRKVDVLITSVLQTPAGRMIFAKMKEAA